VHEASAQLNEHCTVSILNRNVDVSVWLGLGYGTFQAPQRFVAGTWPQSVAVADVDRDGRPDLVVVGGIADISILLHQ
jgi:hypothetical protein